MELIKGGAPAPKKPDYKIPDPILTDAVKTLLEADAFIVITANIVDAKNGKISATFRPYVLPQHNELIRSIVKQLSEQNADFQTLVSNNVTKTL